MGCCFSAKRRGTLQHQQAGQIAKERGREEPGRPEPEVEQSPSRDRAQAQALSPERAGPQAAQTTECEGAGGTVLVPERRANREASSDAEEESDEDSSLDEDESEDQAEVRLNVQQPPKAPQQQAPPASAVELEEERRPGDPLRLSDPQNAPGREETMNLEDESSSEDESEDAQPATTMEAAAELLGAGFQHQQQLAVGGGSNAKAVSMESDSEGDEDEADEADSPESAAAQLGASGNRGGRPGGKEDIESPGAVAEPTPVRTQAVMATDESEGNDSSSDDDSVAADRHQGGNPLSGNIVQPAVEEQISEKGKLRSAELLAHARADFTGQSAAQASGADILAESEVQELEAEESAGQAVGDGDDFLGCGNKKHRSDEDSMSESDSSASEDDEAIKPEAVAAAGFGKNKQTIHKRVEDSSSDSDSAASEEGVATKSEAAAAAGEKNKGDNDESDSDSDSLVLEVCQESSPNVEETPREDRVVAAHMRASASVDGGECQKKTQRADSGSENESKTSDDEQNHQVGGLARGSEQPEAIVGVSFGTEESDSDLELHGHSFNPDGRIPVAMGGKQAEDISTMVTEIAPAATSRDVDEESIEDSDRVAAQKYLKIVILNACKNADEEVRPAEGGDESAGIGAGSVASPVCGEAEVTISNPSSWMAAPPCAHVQAFEGSEDDTASSSSSKGSGAHRIGAMAANVRQEPQEAGGVDEDSLSSTSSEASAADRAVDIPCVESLSSEVRETCKALATNGHEELSPMILQETEAFDEDIVSNSSSDSSAAHRAGAATTTEISSTVAEACRAWAAEAHLELVANAARTTEADGDISQNNSIPIITVTPPPAVAEPCRAWVADIQMQIAPETQAAAAEAAAQAWLELEAVEEAARGECWIAAESGQSGPPSCASSPGPEFGETFSSTVEPTSPPPASEKMYGRWAVAHAWAVAREEVPHRGEWTTPVSPVPLGDRCRVEISGHEQEHRPQEGIDAEQALQPEWPEACDMLVEQACIEEGVAETIAIPEGGSNAAAQHFEREQNNVLNVHEQSDALSRQAAAMETSNQSGVAQWEKMLTEGIKAQMQPLQQVISPEEHIVILVENMEKKHAREVEITCGSGTPGEELSTSAPLGGDVTTAAQHGAVANSSEEKVSEASSDDQQAQHRWRTAAIEKLDSQDHALSRSVLQACFSWARGSELKPAKLAPWRQPMFGGTSLEEEMEEGTQMWATAAPKEQEQRGDTSFQEDPVVCEKIDISFEGCAESSGAAARQQHSLEVDDKQGNGMRYTARGSASGGALLPREVQQVPEELSSCSSTEASALSPDRASPDMGAQARPRLIPGCGAAQDPIGVSPLTAAPISWEQWQPQQASTAEQVAQAQPEKLSPQPPADAIRRLPRRSARGWGPRRSSDALSAASTSSSAVEQRQRHRAEKVLTAARHRALHLLQDVDVIAADGEPKEMPASTVSGSVLGIDTCGRSGSGEHG